MLWWTHMHVLRAARSAANAHRRCRLSTSTVDAPLNGARWALLRQPEYSLAVCIPWSRCRGRLHDRQKQRHCQGQEEHPGNGGHPVLVPDQHDAGCHGFDGLVDPTKKCIGLKNRNELILESCSSITLSWSNTVKINTKLAIDRWNPLVAALPRLLLPYLLFPVGALL